MKKHEIVKLAESHPALFERAVDIEMNAIEAGNLETTRGLGRAYSWKELIDHYRESGTTKSFIDGQGVLKFPETQSEPCSVCRDESDE
jgi:hypothetical protein